MPIVQRSIPYATLQILGSGPYEGKLRSLITSLGLQKSVTIEYISPGDRERMARTLGAAAAVAALSEYEANPLSVMEALALGIPAVGLDTTGIGDLIADGLVRGVPRNASATAIAEALIATLEEDREVSSSAKISTWDAAARSLAQVYLDAIQDGSRPVQSQDAR
jgi:glycosyltransferase involved in cell wall biosynthesis